MTVNSGQTYRDLDRRMAGRTLRVVSAPESADRALLEIVTNPTDIQTLLDDETPGTRSYTPRDRRGKKVRISKARLEDGRSFALVEDPPDVAGPVV